MSWQTFLIIDNNRLCHDWDPGWTKEEIKRCHLRSSETVMSIFLEPSRYIRLADIIWPIIDVVVNVV